MQNTRLNQLANVIGRETARVLQNPWRRLSLVTIAFLFGFFLGNALSTIAGQRAEQDILVAAILVIVIEIVNRLIYNRQFWTQDSIWRDGINSLKIGLIYSLFVEAFKLGS
ncbi:DUF565 domain-containing protein [Roseofilum casamattae]|uniref:DUF565 domain-containing protein n=1 Tax=Roseofilum casamattae BLCC-M143 TaxID=3022442 RepID=A0ABT7BYA7_9CYAN|nr:DUF565 domain-containing protein [Roseofilum casamattae]MDJ1184187.1 DUF565 domain-containing protein [Roseofilum casamattae BLCC-M143]